MKQILTLREHFITCCHEQIAHGAYDMGKTPSIAVRECGEKIMVYKVHIGITKREQENHREGCGIALVNPFVMMDCVSWPLPQ